MEHALVSDASNTVMFQNGYDCGLLIAFEGPDGSGKTTQRKLFKSWLQSVYDDVVVTKWNSSPLFKPLIKAKKTARLLDPGSYGILHAADFWQRYEAVIQPALAEGKIVLADRYIFTGLARDAARGMSHDWCRQLYSGVRKPDIVFYFNASVDTCAMRITASRPLKFYEAGQDVTGMDDAYQSYLRFGQRVATEYERLHQQFGFVIIDADKSVYEQHRFIRETYLKLCCTVPDTPLWKPQLNAFLSEIDV